MVMAVCRESHNGKGNLTGTREENEFADGMTLMEGLIQDD